MVVERFFGFFLLSLFIYLNFGCSCFGPISGRYLSTARTIAKMRGRIVKIARGGKEESHKSEGQKCGAPDGSTPSRASPAGASNLRPDPPVLPRSALRECII